MKVSELEVGQKFQCDEHVVTIKAIDEDRYLVSYVITSPGREDRTDARYADRFVEALKQYGQ